MITLSDKVFTVSAEGGTVNMTCTAYATDGTSGKAKPIPFVIEKADNEEFYDGFSSDPPITVTYTAKNGSSMTRSWGPGTYGVYCNTLDSLILDDVTDIKLEFIENTSSSSREWNMVMRFGVYNGFDTSAHRMHIKVTLPAASN